MTRKEYIDKYYAYLLEGYEETKAAMSKQCTTVVHVKAWINHIPDVKRQGVSDDGWDDRIYQLAYKFMSDLYFYSIQMGYIDEDISMSEFERLKF